MRWLIAGLVWFWTSIFAATYIVLHSHHQVLTYIAVTLGLVAAPTVALLVRGISSLD